MNLNSIPFLAGSGGRKVAVLAVAAAVAIGLWAVGRWASTPTFVTLYRDLDLKESSAISDQLRKAGILFRLEGGGSEVLVPAGDLAPARVALAKEGLPASGRPGLELFDKPSWGMTDFTQRVTYQRALEGELSRTIGGLQGIASAEVHLVIPNTGNLKRFERPPGASVVATLEPGATLSSEAIQGIAYIVSNSVEGLSSENVAIMDNTGKVLSMPSTTTGGAGAATRQLEIQRSVEQYLAEKVENLVGTVVGLGRTRAEVAVQMTFDQVDRTVETFDPDGQVIQNEQRSETAPAAEGADGSQTVVNNAYQNSRRLEKVVGAGGAIEKLSVAVLVDEKEIARAPDAAARLASLEAMVREAVGADSARGDRVSVLPVPFENPVAAVAAPGGAAPKTDPIQVAERFSRPAIGLVAIIALGLIGMTAMRLLTGGGAGSAAPSARPLGGVPELSIVPASGNGNGRAPEGGEIQATARVLRSWLADS